MDALIDSLATLSARPLGTIVHIGAGAGRVLEHYARLAPTRAVLVEGDPDAGDQLRRRAVAWPRTEVHTQPVAARSGPTTWHRYNLASLNGPLDAAALLSYYPRLQLAESTTRDAVALADLIAELKLGRDDSRTDVLILNVPGQEDALLAALPQEQLIAFDAVVLRGCREALEPSGTAAEQAVAQMRSRCYRVEEGNGESEPLWPVTLLRFDPLLHQTAQLEQRAASLEVALQQHQQMAVELQDVNASLSALVETERGLAADRLQQIDALTQECARQGELVSGQQAQIQTLSQSRAELELDLQSIQAQVGTLQQAKAAAEQTAADCAAQTADLARALDEQSRKVAESQARVDALTLAKAELERTSQAELTAVRLEGEAVAKKLGEVEAARAALAQEAVERDARQRLLDTEILKAEAQLELIKDVLIREKNF